MFTYAMSVRRSAWGASRCATGVWLLLWLTSTSPGPAAAQPLQLVQLAEGRLTVAAHDASLRGLIEEISRESGVQLEGADALRGDVTVRFRRRTLEDGLALILSGWRYALTSESGQGPGGSTEPSLFRLRVLGPRKVSFRAPAATAPPADQAEHQPIRESSDGPGPLEALLASDDLTVVRRGGLALGLGRLLLGADRLGQGPCKVRFGGLGIGDWCGECLLPGLYQHTLVGRRQGCHVVDGCVVGRCVVVVGRCVVNRRVVDRRLGGLAETQHAEQLAGGTHAYVSRGRPGTGCRWGLPHGGTWKVRESWNGDLGRAGRPGGRPLALSGPSSTEPLLCGVWGRGPGVLACLKAAWSGSPCRLERRPTEES